MPDRRTFLKAAAAVSLAPLVLTCDRGRTPPPQPWSDAAVRKPDRSGVAVLAAAAYDGRLVDLVRRGTRLCDVDPAGKRVVLKPNFVEFDRDGAINTHPVLIAATIEAFRSMGAVDVTVAEGPGHRRDNDYILAASGLGETLRDAGARYVDLNVDAFRAITAASRYTGLARLFFAETVAAADLLVSMPKLKTHHWAGITLSLKNMFGIMPGAIYGWPKNTLHWAGVGPSILDINATLTVPRFNIVDGIVGMEGDGPIKGEPRASGVVVFGTDPVAVDATGACLMGIEPDRVWHLRQASRFLGNIGGDRIEQLGENLEPFTQDYRLIESMQRLRPKLTDTDIR